MSSFISTMLIRLERHREELVDLGLLALVLNAPKMLWGDPRTPWLVQVLLYLGLALLASPTSVSTAGNWRRYLRMLPGYAGTVVVGTVGFHYWLDLPASQLILAPLWLVLTALFRLPLRSSFQQTVAWLSGRRLDIVGGDCAILAAFTWAGPKWSEQAGPAPLAVAGLALLWFGLHWRKPLHDPDAASHGVVCWTPLGLVIAWVSLWRHFTPSSSWVPVAIAALWLAVALLAFRLAVLRWASSRDAGFAEVMRWIGLLGLIVGFFHPFFRAGLHGSGDALYYATFLADAIEQFRHGVFPVIVGQSEYQFNGSVIPTRIAPAFQYAGGLVDLLTGRQLNFFAIQNILIVVVALGGAASSYLCLRRIVQTPGRAWILAVLFFTCPGVMGLAFNSDLYMSWLAVPLVPVVFYLSLRSFEKTGAALYAALGFALGLTWWAHTPIALWLTMIAFLFQLGRLFKVRIAWPVLVGEFAAGAGAFLACSCYPLVSALLYPATPVASFGKGLVIPANHVLHQLLETFPAAWLPLSDLGRLLTDFQIGYGLLSLGLVVALPAWRTGRWELRLLLVTGAFLLLLLVPIPGVNLTLWQMVPNAVRVVTNVWAMQRLYVLIAACLVFLIAVVWRAGGTDRTPPANRLHLFLTVACIWSLSEALKFVHGSAATITPRSSAPTRLATENIVLSRYSYGFFSGVPAYFTHGVTDPNLENRLLDADLQTLISGNYEAARRQVASASGKVSTLQFAVTEGHLESSSRLLLQPARRYLATLSLNGAPLPQGTLVLEGSRLQRVYGLPEYGEPKSFGRNGERQLVLPLHTSGSEIEPVRVLLVPSGPIELGEFPGRLQMNLGTYEPSALPVQVKSWIPYGATVASPTDAWLETPRMFQVGYRARVNGQDVAVQRSAEGLVSLPVPTGFSQVELRYFAPPGLLAAFWLSILALSAGGLFTLLAGLRMFTRSTKAGAKLASARQRTRD